ncbi:MAG: hypothetical protein ACO21M_03935, partial [Vulcanococcus sp.]
RRIPLQLVIGYQLPHQLHQTPQRLPLIRSKPRRASALKVERLRSRLSNESVLDRVQRLIAEATKAEL